MAAGPQDYSNAVDDTRRLQSHDSERNSFHDDRIPSPSQQAAHDVTIDSQIIDRGWKTTDRGCDFARARLS